METIKDFYMASDNVKLFYRISGSGKPLVILSGFGQDSTGFSKNYEELDKYFTVYTFDYRGHGQSDTPEHGYHIERFAKDLYDFIEHMKLEKFYLLAHSMGNAVLWSYISMFGQQKIIKYILDDEAPCLVCDPMWNDDEKEMYTGLFQAKDIWISLGGFSEAEPTLRNRMQLRLLRDHLGRDWRDIIPTIEIPTMVLMGGASHFNSKLLWDWITDNIKGSKLEVISAENGGTHDMHVTNPELFNGLAIEFFTT